jgi:small basic protein (TIGR04137 family)
MDPSLKIKSGGTTNRSVYTRAERLEKLAAEKKDQKQKALGLAKTRISKV